MDIPKQEKSFVLYNLFGALPEKKRDKLSFGNEKNEIVIITDMGEECDDEVTIAAAVHFANKTDDFNFTIFCTDDNWEEILCKLEFNLEMKNVMFHHINEINTELPDTKFDLLQIGPVDDTYLADSFKGKKYDYYLLGELGKTTNSNGEAKTFAENVYNTSMNKYIIMTKDEKANVLAPQFNYKVISESFNNKYLNELVLRIAFRNTVGRASIKGGKFVAHLVSTEGGANYNTVKQQTEYLGIKNDDTLYSKAYSVATEYIKGLEQYEFDGTNSIAGKHITSDTVLNGYIYILLSLYKMYKVPIKFYESGVSRNWNHIWNNLSADKELSKAFNNFIKVNKLNSTLPLTPAYDCIGLLAVLSNKLNKFDDYFFKDGNKIKNKPIDIEPLIETISDPTKF